MIDRPADTGPRADAGNDGSDGAIGLFERYVTSKIARVATLISGVCLVTIIAIFGWQVFGRYVLNATPTWTEQLGLLLVVYIAFLSAAVGVRDNTHLSVTLLVDALPRGVRPWLRTLADLVMAGFGATLAKFGWDLAKFGWSTNIPLINIPDGWRTVPVVIGGAMIVVFAVIRILRRHVLRDDVDAHDDVDTEVAAAAVETARS